MTIKEYKRCIHCGVEYIFQATGWGAPEGNNQHYCCDCYIAMMQALRKIPVRFRMEWQNVLDTPKYKDITIEIVLEWEKQNRSNNKDKIVGERIFAQLFDLNDPCNHNYCRMVIGQDQFSGVRFYVSTWTKSKDYELKVPMEFDVIEGRFTGVEWRGKV